MSLSGNVTNTIINGGTQNIFTGDSTAPHTTINSRGTQNISEYGTATYTTINKGGTQNVLSGGLATNTTIKGGMQAVDSGGSIASTTIYSGGTLALDGGIATNITANSGGVIDMYSGAALSGTTNLKQATIDVGDTSRTYTISDLIVTIGGTINLATGKTVGNRLTVGQLSGAANFVINTDLDQGKADQISITSATGQAVNTLAVNVINSK